MNKNPLEILEQLGNMGIKVDFTHHIIQNWRNTDRKIGSFACADRDFRPWMEIEKDNEKQTIN